MEWQTCKCNSKERIVQELDNSRCGLSEIPGEVYVTCNIENFTLERNKVSTIKSHIELFTEMYPNHGRIIMNIRP